MRYIALIFLLAVTAYNSRAQLTYHPLVKEGATWHYEYVETGPAYDYYAYEGLTLSGDTVINGKLYKKLWLRHSSDSLSLNGRNFGGALREDSLKRVYYIGAGSQVELQDFGSADSVELLIYDFGLQKGGKMTMTVYNSTTSPYYTVDSVTTIMVDGQPRRKWYVNDGTSAVAYEYWIEGIGSNLWLLKPYTYYFESGYELGCYDDSLIHYQADWVEDCTTVSITERLQKPEVAIYPNPVADQLNIQLQQAVLPAEVIIVDMQGREHQQLELTHLDTKVPVNRLPTGMYFYTLTDSRGHVTTGKLVKAE